MQENADDALEVEVLANALRSGKAESTDLLETLATRLKLILPDSVSVERGGWFLSATRPVTQLTVRFDDCHLQVGREKSGAITARSLKVVKGVVLKTTIISLDDWINSLANLLAQAAKNNAQTLTALQKFVVG